MTILSFASLAFARPAIGQHGPIAVVLNSEDGRSLGLAILQPADGVSLMLPASAAVVRVAPGAAEVTSHAVRWSAAQTATVERVTVVLRVSGDASASGRVVVSNGTDVRTIELSADGARVMPASSRASTAPPTVRTTAASSGSSWLSVASTQFSGAPVPRATGPILDAEAHGSSRSAPPTPSTPSTPARPAPTPDVPDPRPVERAAVFNLASKHKSVPVVVRRAVAGAPPVPTTTPVPASAPRVASTTPAWHFASSLGEPTGSAPDSMTARAQRASDSAPALAHTTTPASAETTVVVQENPQPVSPPGYTVADLFTSTGFPKPTRITESREQGAMGSETPADAVAVTDRWRARGVIRVAGTQSVGVQAARGGEVSLEQPMNGSVALTVTGGANGVAQYATAGIRIAPHAAASSTLSPFLAIALGATAHDQTTATRFAFAGGIQVPLTARAMIEVGGERVVGAEGTSLLHVGIRALFGMGS